MYVRLADGRSFHGDLPDDDLAFFFEAPSDMTIVVPFKVYVASCCTERMKPPEMVVLDQRGASGQKS